MSWRDLGKDPDYRFSLANERTFLAWIRTALAILAGAIILREFDSDAHESFTLLSGALAALAAIIGASAYWRWRGNELAMRLEGRLPAPTLIVWLAGAVTLFGAGLAIWLFLLR